MPLVLYVIMVRDWKEGESCSECGTTELQHHARGLCLRCYARFARKQNPEKYREISRRHGATEKRKEWRKQYESTEEYKKNMIERAAKYRASHNEVCLDRTREWRDKNRDKIKEYNDARKDIRLVKNYGQDALKKIMECDYSCQKCGLKNRVAIHHIDWNPKNNVYDNFAVLCGNCHSRVHMWSPLRLRKSIFDEWMVTPLEELDTDGRRRGAVRNLAS